MQAASSPYVPSPPQPFYQNIYHIPPFAPQDHELKRQYLALLPSQQIIEICLSFDVHVPPYIKSTIWPPDINAAIANLQKPAANGDAFTLDKDNDKPPEPVMDSLDRPSEESSSPEANTASTEPPTAEPQPPDKQPDNVVATTTPAAQTPAPAPVQQQPPYPHQPYGYPQHPPATYPHAPYYPPPPGYPSYPPSYLHYSLPVPNGFAHPPPPPPHPAYPPPPNPMYPGPHVPQPPPHQDQGSDDLPSYEEMIVEALQESTDPEGCAPKDLFAWMAARYPLQSNFRPSASQALQKAFKRGRFEKSSNGKYRLSATWEGGNTSKRTTRRPQTQSQSQSNLASSSASPFTHAPLVHHHHHSNSAHQAAHPQLYPGQPYPYPYGTPIPPGFPGYPPPQPPIHPHLPTQPHPQSAPLEATKNTTDPTGKPGASSSDADRDAYEAAQNILKAINFGDLFQIAQQGPDGKRQDDVSMDQLTSLLIQAQNVISQPQQPTASSSLQQMSVAQQVSPQPVVPLPTLSATAGVAVAAESSPRPPMNVRAELQAQLALLAAQLADLGQESGESVGLSAAQDQSPPPVVSGSQSQELPQQEQQSLVSATSTSTAPDLEPPIMDALLPPVEFPVQQLQSQSPAPPPPQHPEEAQRLDGAPPNPPLQTITVGIETSVSTQPAVPTQDLSPPDVEPSPVAPAGSAPTAAFLAPPPIFAAVGSQPQPQAEAGPPVVTHNFVAGEDDSNDDDMEEII